jgi:hypothetical protein
VINMRKSHPINPKNVPAGATTVELTEAEMLHALGAYIGEKTGENFKATMELEVVARPGSKMRFIVSYWRPS